MPGMHLSPDPDGGALLAWGYLPGLQDGDISFYKVTAKSHIPHSHWLLSPGAPSTYPQPQDT